MGKNMRAWLFIIALCIGAPAVQAANTTQSQSGALCLKAEGYFDTLNENTFHKQIYNFKLMDVYSHYLNIFNHCPTGERKNNYILLISNIITFADAEPVLEKQVKNTNGYKNILLFLEGLSENLYDIWAQKGHICGLEESENLIKLNRLGSLFTQHSQDNPCQSCYDIFQNMEERIRKVYICNDDTLPENN